MAKGKGKKKGSKKEEEEAAAAKKKQEEDDLAAEEEDDTEFQKALLEIRIKELEQLKVGMQRKCEFLENQAELYKTQFEEMKEEMDDIIAHLNRCYSEGKTTIRELEDRLYGMQEARQDDAKEFQERLAQKDRERVELQERMEKEIMELNSKLATLEEFRLQRENLLAEKENLKKTLEDERKSFHVSYNDLENKTIMYKEKLRKEATEMLVKMSKDVHKAGKLCLTATVKSAISSNIKLQDELETTSKKNIELRKKIEALSEQLRERKMTIEVIEEENTAVHRKCLEYKELVVKLIDTHLELESRIKHFKGLKQELKRLEEVHSLCRTDEEVQYFVAKEIEKILEERRLQELQQEKLTPEEVEGLQKELRNYQSIIVKLAVAAKNLSQSVSPEEQNFLKEQLKDLLRKTYAIALEIPELPQEVTELLTMRFPDVSSAVGTIQDSKK